MEEQSKRGRKWRGDTEEVQRLTVTCRMEGRKKGERKEEGTLECTKKS